MCTFRLEADKVGDQERRVTANRAGVFKCITRLILRNTVLLIVPYFRAKTKTLHSARPRGSSPLLYYFARPAGLPIGRGIPPLFPYSTNVAGSRDNDDGASGREHDEGPERTTEGLVSRKVNHP